MAGRMGWVYGVSVGRGAEGHEWLTVPGSAYEAPELAEAAGGAVRTWPSAAILARVAEVWHPGVTGPRGMAYQVIERPPLCDAGGRVAPFVLTEGLDGEQPAGAVCKVECPECGGVVVVHVAADRSAAMPEHTRPVAAAGRCWDCGTPLVFKDCRYGYWYCPDPRCGDPGHHDGVPAHPCPQVDATRDGEPAGRTASAE